MSYRNTKVWASAETVLLVVFFLLDGVGCHSIIESPSRLSTIVLSSPSVLPEPAPSPEGPPSPEGAEPSGVFKMATLGTGVAESGSDREFDSAQAEPVRRDVVSPSLFVPHESPPLTESQQSLARNPLAATRGDSEGTLHTNANLDTGVQPRLPSGHRDAFQRLQAESWDPLADTVWRDDPLDSERTRLSIGETIWEDHKNFYSGQSLGRMAGGFAIGALIANSSMDDGIQRHFQSSVRSANSDEWFESLHASKELGNGTYTLPVFGLAWALGRGFSDSESMSRVGDWGERSIRGFVVGAPAVIVLQQLTGGSRPDETAHQSKWQPLADNNGVSGHAFMGALPFITAAKLSERPQQKAVFYLLSTVAPLSRVNDNAHYPSQVLLGWWMAYLAASAVDSTQSSSSQWSVSPYSSGDSHGLSFEYRF